MDFRIIIKNGVNCLVYDEIVNARDENNALKKLLEKVTISTDDTIEIKEISEEEKNLRSGIAKKNEVLSSLVKDLEDLSKLTDSYDESKLLKDLRSKLIDISSTLVEYETKERGLEELEV